MKKVRGRGRSPVAPLCGRGYVEKRPALHEHSDIDHKDMTLSRPRLNRICRNSYSICLVESGVIVFIKSVHS